MTKNNTAITEKLITPEDVFIKRRKALWASDNQDILRLLESVYPTCNSIMERLEKMDRYYADIFVARTYSTFEVVGIAMAMKSYRMHCGPVLIIDSIATADNTQGIGRALIEHVTQFYKADVVQLDCHVDNVAAQGFYEHVGFYNRAKSYVLNVSKNTGEIDTSREHG